MVLIFQKVKIIIKLETILSFYKVVEMAEYQCTSRGIQCKITVVVVQLLSHVQLFVTSQDCSTQDFPVLHHLPEFAKTHVHWVGDAIQPSHPLMPPSPSALNLSQHESLFQRAGSLHQVAKVLELQHQSFQWIFRVDFLQDWLVWSPWSPGDSQKSSLTAQLKSISSSVLSLLYGPTLTSIHDYWKNHSFD